MQNTLPATGAATPWRRRALGAAAALCCLWATTAQAADAAGADAPPASAPLAQEFQRDVAPRLQLPAAERLAYAARLQEALDGAAVKVEAEQFIVLVDRAPKVQAALLFWGSAGHGWDYVGATPVSTGLPGTYEHFLTPLGVFNHSLDNPDFRSEGTKNALGFRGYGRKDLRIYDFGWVASPRGWGDGAMGELRLQMHSTDPQLAEPLLGTPRSEGCVRIPAALNDFIDRHGLLDADYQEALAAGTQFWVLRADRTVTASPGRYMVVVDTRREKRPAWSPAPARR